MATSTQTTVAAQTAAAAAAQTTTPTSAAVPVVNAEEITDPFVKLSDHIKGITAIVKQLQRDFNKKEKSSSKKKASTSTSTTRNNFSTPVPISDAMCAFLGLAQGSKLARTDVTRGINAYIKEHNLNDQANKRVIIPDAKLKTILKVDDPTVQLTYFNMQTYNKHNFV